MSMTSEVGLSVLRTILLRSNLYEQRKGNVRLRLHFCSAPVFILSMLVMTVLSVKIFSTLVSRSALPDKLETYQLYDSAARTPSNETMTLNVHEHPVHHIYIDIGCYNGETVEHFIHFTPNSSLYDIITFEPDPENYRICRQRLSQEKYKKFNIAIIPKAVWTRDEQVYFRAGLGSSSCIDRGSSNQYGSIPLDAIDFSRWLSRLTKSNRTKMRIKLSIPGAEIPVLEKMILDDTIELADRWDIEWSDRSNHKTRPQRVYIQSMFDSLGYDFLYLTRLHDLRKVFRVNGTIDKVPKYYDWMSIPLIDTYNHYVQRRTILDPPRTTKVPVTPSPY